MYRSFYNGFSKVEAAVEWLEKAVYLILMAVLIFCIFFQVLGRYILGLATPWAEEIARYSWVWITWIFGGHALRYGRHIVMNLIDGTLEKTKNPHKAFFIMSKFSYAFVLAFMALVTYFFWQYFAVALRGSRVTVATGIPMWVIFLGVLVGMILMTIQAAYVLLEPYEKPQANTETEIKEDEEA